MTNLAETSARAEAVARRAADRATVDDLDAGFIDLLQEFEALSAQVGDQFSAAERALSAVKLRQLDGSEQTVYDHIQRHATANGAVDVGLLLQDEAIGAASPNGDVWRVLEQLYRKRRLTVHVAVNRPVEG